MVEEYSAGIITECFWFVEFKKMVALVTQGMSKEELRTECVDNNTFATDTPHRAEMIFRYLYKRVNNLDETLINLFRNSDIRTQKLINLIAVLRNDRLFFEFIYEVYREKIILGDLGISSADTRAFLRSKRMQSEKIDGWTDRTFENLQTTYITFLKDAGLVAEAETGLSITPPLMDTVLEHCLETNGEGDFVKAFTGVK